MFYLIFTVLFLKPSLKKEDVPSQIGRAILGFLISVIVFYFGKADRSISLLVSLLWIPAMVQFIFAVLSDWVRRYDSKKRHESKGQSGILVLAYCGIFIFSICFSFYPYITGGAKKLASMVNVKESTDKVSKIDTQHIIVIAPETAYYEMQKMLGSLPNPSVYRIGELGVTMTKDGACYVAPIEVDGNIRALSNNEIPGVMYVSAEKPEDAKIIKASSKYANSLVFGNNLERYLRGYKPSAILFQANAELDDNENPYFVGSYGHYKYGRKGPVIDGVLLVSFKDGSVKDYPVGKVPEWVDEVYPSDVAEDYNTYFGTLQKGLLNKMFSRDGVHIPTAWSSGANVDGLEVNSNEVTGVIDADGSMKWFTDHTNVSETSTTMTGYSLMNMRTGEMIYYKTPGYINGKGAMNAVDKTLGANKSNWSPVQPIFYNIFGTEAWVVPVVNKTDGALVKVAIVAAQNSYVVLEDSKDAAIESFKNAIAYGTINSSSGKNANNIKADEKSISGKVYRINSVNENGNTVFYLKLEGESRIFMVTKNAGVDIVLTKEGDQVNLKYLDIQNNPIVSVTAFKNNSIEQ